MHQLRLPAAALGVSWLAWGWLRNVHGRVPLHYGATIPAEAEMKYFSRHSVPSSGAGHVETVLFVSHFGSTQPVDVCSGAGAFLWYKKYVLFKLIATGALNAMQAPVRERLGAQTGGRGTRTMDIAILPIYSFGEEPGGVTLEVRSRKLPARVWSSLRRSSERGATFRQHGCAEKPALVGT